MSTPAPRDRRDDRLNSPPAKIWRLTESAAFKERKGINYHDRIGRGYTTKARKRELK